MTDMKTLLSQVDLHVRRTTISYPTFLNNVRQGKYTPKDGSGTEWGMALRALQDAYTQASGVLDPPPAPTVPTTGGTPWPGWNHEVSMNQATLPDRHFTYGSDGTVTLTCFPDSPQIGAGTANPRQLASTWINNQPALQAEGKLSFWRTFVTFMDPHTTGENNWVMEWHTVSGDGAGKYSCAIGVHTDYPVDFTKPGTNPRWMFQVTGPAGVRTYYGPAVTLGQRYDLAVEIGWSSTNGHFLVDIDGARVCADVKPNLYVGDQPGFGLYNYRLAVPWTARTVFSQPRFGATRADVGL